MKKKYIYKNTDYKQFSAFIRLIEYKKAFTLIEVLIVAAMIVTVIGAFFSLFSGTMNKVNIGYWKSRTQLKMRAAMKRLHMDISSATYPALIALNKTTVDKDDKWALSYKPGKTFFKTQAGSSTSEAPEAGEIKLLEYYICIPGHDTPIKKSSKKIIKAVLTAQVINKKNVLVLDKYLVEGDEAQGDLQKTILLEDVYHFNATHYETPGIKIDDPINIVLKLEVRAQNFYHSQSGLNESIDIPLNVRAVGNL